MVNAVNTTLDITPKRLNRVDVGNTRHVLLGSVLDYLMSVAKPFNLIVRGEFIGKNDGFVFPCDTLLNHRKQGVGFDVGDYLSNSIPVTFNHPHDNGLASSTTTALATPLTPDVSFVNLNLPTKGVDVLSHEFTNLIEYTPRCFVGDTQFPFKLLGGNARFGGSHKEYGVKPRTKRSIRLVKDSASRRGYMRATELAGIDLATRYAIMGSYLFTLRAVNTFWESSLEKIVKAGIISRKLLVKIFDSVGFHLFSPNLTLYLNYSRKPTCCQGIEHKDFIKKYVLRGDNCQILS